MGWCDLLSTRPLSLWLGFKAEPIFQIRRLPKDVARQQSRLGHVGNIKLGPEVLCLGVSSSGLCAICLLVVRMASSVFPQVRLFLHLVSLGTAAGGLHKKELANRRIVRDTSLASVALERPAAMVCLQDAWSPIITHGDQDKPQERSCSSSAEVALLGGLMTHAIRDARCIPPCCRCI